MNSGRKLIVFNIQRVIQSLRKFTGRPSPKCWFYPIVFVIDFVSETIPLSPSLLSSRHFFYCHKIMLSMILKERLKNETIITQNNNALKVLWSRLIMSHFQENNICPNHNYLLQIKGFHWLGKDIYSPMRQLATII